MNPPVHLYSHRPKPYSSELELQLDDRQVAAERGRSRQVYPLKDIELIHLVFAPQNLARLAFRCEIRARDGKSIRFDTISWRSLIAVERQDAEYRAFISDLVMRAARANPALRLEAGIGRHHHGAMTILGLALLALLAASIPYFLTVPLYFFAGLAGFSALYFGFWLRDYLKRNRPRIFTADSIPAEVMPPPG